MKKHYSKPTALIYALHNTTPLMAGSGQVGVSLMGGRASSTGEVLSREADDYWDEDI